MTIVQVSEKYNISADALRYYEKIQKFIERLDVKINNYDEIVVTAENKLRNGFADGETSICEKS